MNAATSNTDMLDAGCPGSSVLSASTLEEDDIYSLKGEKLGGINEFMLDIRQIVSK